MTRFKYYSNYLACLLGTLIAFELCWIGAKYVIEGEVVHTCLDHFIAVCGSFYITRDTMKIWLKLQARARRCSTKEAAMRKDIPLHQYPKDVQIATPETKPRKEAKHGYGKDY